jgi:hypothetical protein
MGRDGGDCFLPNPHPIKYQIENLLPLGWRGLADEARQVADRVQRPGALVAGPAVGAAQVGQQTGALVK